MIRGHSTQTHMKFLIPASAVIIGLVLLTAAICKFIYPWEVVHHLEKSVAAFELVFVLALACFFRKTWIWLFSSQVFAAWAGYSLFWIFQALPCSCMGRAFELPKGVLFGADILFFALSLWVASKLGSSKHKILFFLGLGLVLAILGFFFGKWVVDHYITPLFNATMS